MDEPDATNEEKEQVDAEEETEMINTESKPEDAEEEALEETKS